MADEVRTLKLNLNDIAIGDIEDFEEYTGETLEVIDKIGAGGNVSAKVYTGMALLALRQQNRDATIEEARGVTIGELQMAASAIAEEDPTVAGQAEITPLRNKAKETRSARRTAG